MGWSRQTSRPNDDGDCGCSIELCYLHPDLAALRMTSPRSCRDFLIGFWLLSSPWKHWELPLSCHVKLSALMRFASPVLTTRTLHRLVSASHASILAKQLLS